MPTTPAGVEKRIFISHGQAERLSRLAQLQHTSEDHVIGKALEILFSLTDLLDERFERRDWSALSNDAFARVWDNDADAAYDNWQELYGVSTG
jgi:hypothetical protein